MQKSEINTSQNALYLSALRFSEEHNGINYSEFDGFVLRQLTLFDIPDEDFLHTAEETVDEIISALPAFKRIFSRPIVRLKDEKEIVPVEAIRSVDNHSLAHLSSHCALWDNVSKKSITPKKLMTIEYSETYSIYENIAFAYAVNKILSFTKQTLIRLSDVLYGHRDIHFNLLDRTHHNLYFLAIGKLHLGYARANVSKASAQRLLEKLLFVEKTLHQKLSSPVYVACRKKKFDSRLKKTNIFRSHKDYAEVYRILNMFEAGNEASESITDVSSDSEEFKNFVTLLSLFAIGHFNFSFDENAAFDFKKINTSASFLGWKLTVQAEKTDEADVLLFKTQKEKEYISCLIFSESYTLSPSKLTALKAKVGADEYLFCSPNVFGERDVLYLSIFDVDSFCRIQQIVLRGMIYSDSLHEDCPFCGSALQKNGDAYECKICDAEIKECICAKHSLPFYVSGIKHSSHKSANDAPDERRKFLHDRLHEAKLHFRNITPISEDGSPICPHCGKQMKNR